MKWPTHTKKVGATRIVVRRAWFPVDLEGGTTIWWEKYFSHEEVKEDVHHDGVMAHPVERWVPVKAVAIPPDHWR